MSDIQVSLYLSGVRVPYWREKFFKQFEMNTVNYEIIIAGPVQPDYELPPNVRFIHVNPDPGPVYCMAIAGSLVQGETILPCADDVVYTPFALDHMYNTYKEQNDYKCMVHARYGFGPDTDVTDVNNELPIPGTQWRFAIGILYSRKFREEIGGYDRRYRGGASEGDMQIRGLVAGGRYVYAKDAYVQEDMSYIGHNALNPARAWGRWNGRADNALMISQWWPNGVLQRTPTTPIEEMQIEWTENGPVVVNEFHMMTKKHP